MPDATDQTLQLGMLGGDVSEAIKAQRQLALAQALQQMAMTPANQELQQPAGGGKYYQAARVGPISAVSKIAQALMAKRGFNAALPQMASVYQRAQQAFAPGGQSMGSVPLQAPQNSNPNEQTVQPAIQRLPGASLEQTLQAANPGVTPQNPLNPTGLPALAIMRLYEKDPGKYAALLQGTPEWQNALRASGGDPRQATALMHAEMVKKGSINMRGGETALIPNEQGGFTTRRAPNLPSGYEPLYDAQGNYVDARLPSGILAGETQKAGSEAAARQANELHTLPTQGGGSQISWGADIGGGPPAARPAARVPQYFPPVHQSGPVNLAGGGVSRPDDPFPDAPRTPTYSGLGAPNAQDAILQKARAERHVAQFEKYGAESDLADATLTRIGEAQKALAGSNAGPMSHEMTKVQATLHQMFPSIFDGEAATNTQIANKNMVTIALNGAKGIYGPRMTSSEVMLQKNEASPSTEQTREAASYLLKQQAIISQYNKKRAADYQAYVEHGHDPLKFEGWYSAHHSLQNFALQHDSERQSQLAKDRGINVPAAAFDRLTQRPELKEGFKRQFGYLPEGYD